MSVIPVIATLVYYVLLLFFFVMWARFILDLARNFARGWKPRGVGLVLAEVVFSVTDPPITAVRRVVPPLRFGGVALDFGWSLVMLAVVVLIYITAVFRSAPVG